MGALVFTPSSFTLDKDLLRVPPAGPSNFGYRIIFTFFGGGGGALENHVFGGEGRNPSSATIVLKRLL